MGQQYTGPGIYTVDEDEPLVYSRGAANADADADADAEDPVLHYQPSTRPGTRLPHVWLNKAVPATPTSTIDLAGRGRVVLLTGIGGEAWKQAAERVSAELDGVPIVVYSIGFRQDWEDFYFEWERVRGVNESGAVLVRPDRFVAWRAKEVVGDVDACAEKLGRVMRSMLGFE